MNGNENRNREKMMGKTFGEVMHQVHGLAREKGWWRDNERADGTFELPTAVSVLAKLMLVVSELSEAVEEARKPGFDPLEIYYVKGADEMALAGTKDGYRVPWPTHEGKLILDVRGIDVMGGQFRRKPEGFGVEIGDAVIRIFDLCGATNVDAELMNKERPVAGATSTAILGEGTPDAVLAALMHIVIDLGRTAEHVMNGLQVEFAVEITNLAHKICNVAGDMHIDIQEIIELKHDYNKSRPYRHGNKGA